MAEGNPVIGVLIVLVSIIIGIMVYWNIATTNEMDAQNTLYTGLTNTSDMEYALPYTPVTFDGTWYNSSSSAWAALNTGMYTLTGTRGDTLTFLTNTGDNDCLNMTQANITYYTNAGILMGAAVNPAANSVFTLAPIIAIVLIAGVILAVVMGFGKKEF